MRPRAAQWRRALVHPAVLVAALLALAGTAALLAAPRTAAPRVPEVALEPPPAPRLERARVRLWAFDADGLERPVLVELPLPAATAGRLEAVLAALRAELAPDGRWPAGLPAPRVFLVEEARRRTAVVDWRPDGPLGLDVAAEERLHRAVVATLRENGADRVAFLREGEPTGVFLEQIRVPAAL